MPEKRFVITCRECTHFKPFADQEYGECTRKMFRGAIVKSSDYCSYAEKKASLTEYDDHTTSGLLEE